MTEPGGDVWKIGAEWCDAHRIPYPPRCVGPCHRTFVRLKMDRVGLTYDRERGPVCEECSEGMIEMANIRWDDIMTDQPLWSEAAELHDGGMTWDETAAELNRRYNLGCLGATVSQVVRRRRERGKGGGDEGGDAVGGAALPRGPVVAGNGGPASMPAPPTAAAGDGVGGQGSPPLRTAAAGDGGAEDVPRGTSPPDGGDDGTRAKGLCHIEVKLDGFYLRVEGETPQQLRERISLGDSILAGGGEG